MDDDDEAPPYGPIRIDVEPLPEGWTPLEMVAIVKCMDESGTVRLLSRYSEGLNTWEAIGMMEVELVGQKDIISASFNGEDDNG